MHQGCARSGARQPLHRIKKAYGDHIEPIAGSVIKDRQLKELSNQGLQMFPFRAVPATKKFFIANNWCIATGTITDVMPVWKPL
jgi:hypothetical protein